MRLSVIFLVSFCALLSSLGAAERYQSRHLEGVEFLAPLGTHKLGDLFLSLGHLNQDGVGEFPKVKDDRLVTLRPGDKRRSFLITPKRLLQILNYQVKLFDHQYRVEVSRKSFRLIRNEAKSKK